MDCQEFRSKLDEYADDAADADWSAAAEEHVAGCAECGAAVAGIRKMRAALRRTVMSERVPSDLADRVRGAIRAEASTGMPIDRDHPPATLSFGRWVTPLAMAAAVALVFVGSQFMPQGVPSGGPQGDVEATWVSAVRTVHAKCLMSGEAHHADGLPRELSALRGALKTTLALDVLVPDLSAAGFKLHSADMCRIQGVPGAHLVYERESDEKLVSLFTIAQTGVFEPTESFKLGDRAAFVCTNDKAPVMSWENASSTFVFCGEIEAASMATLGTGLAD